MVHYVWKKVATRLLLCQMLVIFKLFHQKVYGNEQYISPPHLKCIATLPSQKFVLKNSHIAEPSEANCHAKLSLFEEWMKK